MAKKLIFGLITFFLLVQIVSAVDTEIKVKTLPDHEVQCTILYSSSSSSVLESFKNNSDEYGDISFVYSSDKSKFGLILFVKKDGGKIISRKYLENFIVGTPVYRELAPPGFEFIATPDEINETLNATNQTIENITTDENESEIFIEETEEETEVQLAGSAIVGDKGFLTKKTIYYTIGIIVLLIGFLVIKTVRKKLSVPKEIKTKKLSDVIKEKKEKLETNEENKPATNEEIIADAEEKIKQAQEDIRKIRNEDKIKQAKKKIEEDEEELIRLRRGEE